MAPPAEVRAADSQLEKFSMLASLSGRILRIVRCGVGLRIFFVVLIRIGWPVRGGSGYQAPGSMPRVVLSRCVAVEECVR